MYTDPHKIILYLSQSVGKKTGFLPKYLFSSFKLCLSGKSMMVPLTPKEDINNNMKTKCISTFL